TTVLRRLLVEGLAPGRRGLLDERQELRRDVVGAGAHVVFKGGASEVKDGPFTETKELIGGFYVLEVKSKEEAIAWARRYPGGMGNDDVMEIRPLTGSDDIPAEFLALIKKAAPTWSESFHKKSP
ncbi:MAG: hypothetical protein EOO72_08895, partial [Myxococcaceae bacterium]